MKPSNFNVTAYQHRINDLTGTRDTRPLVLIDWAPDRFRWFPHRLGSDPPGYTYPSFCNTRDENGELHSPERWALWARHEPEQYGPQWEANRYVRHNGVVWDVKGPCPPERYAELRVHAYHDATCCPCDGYECACDDHCWGKYAEPNGYLFDWIRRVAWEAVRDPDIDPTDDVRFHESPHEQQAIASRVDSANYRADVEHDEFNRKMVDEWMRGGVTTSGLKQTASGIYLIDN